jgi:hypothetical protein
MYGREIVVALMGRPLRTNSRSSARTEVAAERLRAADMFSCGISLPVEPGGRYDFGGRTVRLRERNALSLADDDVHQGDHKA